jgi:hypothetical protein
MAEGAASNDALSARMREAERKQIRFCDRFGLIIPVSLSTNRQQTRR